MPGYEKVTKAFRQWNRKHNVIFEQHPKTSSEFSYYLEGSIQNIASIVYALPSGLTALENGRYFIAECDAEYDLTPLLRKLRLRGMECK